MKLNLVFSSPDPSPEMVADMVLRSIDNLMYPLQVDIKQRCQWCKDDKWYKVDAFDLLNNFDLTNLIHGGDGDNHIKIYYTRRKCKDIMDEIWKKDYSKMFYYNMNDNNLSCFTWFEEWYNEPELSNHQKIFDEIIIH